MKKSIILIFLIMIMTWCKCTDTFASEELDEYNLEDIQSFLNNDEEHRDIDFKKIVKEIMTGESKNVFKNMAENLLHNAWIELVNNRKSVIKIILIAFISAVFSNFSAAFSDKQINETGFYVVYMVVITILISGFEMIVSVAENMVKLVLGYVEVLLPSYILAIGSNVGTATGTGYYEIMLITMMAIEYIFLKIVIPAVRLYVIVILINNILQEDMLSKTADIINMVIRWIIKILIGFVTGINVLQGVMLPAVDYVKGKGVYRALASLTGTGTKAFIETVLGSGLLIKNAIGVAGIIVILCISAIPVIKVAVYILMYRISAALIQPVSDKRIVESVGGVYQGAEILMKVMIGTMMVLMISIVVICCMTNRI